MKTLFILSTILLLAFGIGDILGEKKVHNIERDWLKYSNHYYHIWKTLLVKCWIIFVIVFLIIIYNSIVISVIVFFIKSEDLFGINQDNSYWFIIIEAGVIASIIIVVNVFLKLIKTEYLKDNLEHYSNLLEIRLTQFQIKLINWLKEQYDGLNDIKGGYLVYFYIMIFAGLLAVPAAIILIVIILMFCIRILFFISLLLIWFLILVTRKQICCIFGK